MRRVRCPACAAIIQASSDVVVCNQCGLKGRVDAPPAQRTPAGKKTKPTKAARSAPAPKPASDRDPWQITIDLRMVNPARWPAGVRAFSIVVLIAAAFFAGGIAGAAFERTKSDVLADLDDGVFGAGSTASTTPAATSATTPPAAQATPTPQGDPVPAPQESPSTLRQEFTDADSAPKVTLEGGLVRVEINFDDGGTLSRFAAKFLQDGKVQQTITASSSGTYNAVRYLEIPAGTYDLEIGLSSESSTWRLRIEEPRGEEASSPTGVFSAHGDNGIGPLQGDGTMDVTFTASKHGAGTVSVKVFRADGTQVKSCGTGFGDTSPEDVYTKTWHCTIGAQTLVYFDIGHPYDKEDEWTLQVA